MATPREKIAQELLEEEMEARAQTNKLKRAIGKVQEVLRNLTNDDPDTLAVKADQMQMERELTAQLEIAVFRLQEIQEDRVMLVDMRLKSDYGTPDENPVLHATHAVHAPHVDQHSAIPETKRTSFVPKLSDLNRITLPMLTSVAVLRTHYQRVERILLENRMGCMEKRGNDGDQFIPHCTMVHSIFAKFFSTLEIKNVKETAEHLADYESDWHLVKKRLLERYADATVLSREYKTLVSSLQWKGPDNYGQFIESVRQTWRVGQLVHTRPELEQKCLLQSICKQVGSDLVDKIFRRLDLGNTLDWEFHTTLEQFLDALAIEARYENMVRANTKGAEKHTAAIAPNASSTHRETDRVRVIASDRIDPTKFHKVVVIGFGRNGSDAASSQLHKLMVERPKGTCREYQRNPGIGYIVGCSSAPIEIIELVIGRKVELLIGIR